MIQNIDYKKNQAFELVSVIIPCFNSGDTIQQAVASVKTQTWPHVEIVVIDDGSTDNSLSLIKDYQKKLLSFCFDGDKFEGNNGLKEEDKNGDS